MVRQTLIAVLALSVVVYAPAVAGLEGEEVEQLIFGFCYALDASGKCGDLQVRLDTEGKVEAKVGRTIRERGNHHPACSQAIYQAFEDYEALRRAEGGNYEAADQRFCQKVWDEYGCEGSRVARLIQRNPFGGGDGPFCSFE